MSKVKLPQEMINVGMTAIRSFGELDYAIGDDRLEDLAIEVFLAMDDVRAELDGTAPYTGIQKAARSRP